MSRGSLLLLAALKRAASGLLLLIGATLLIYLTIRSAPGNAIDAICPMGTPEADKLRLAAEFGLDRDPFTGYLAWLARSFVGDFGDSLVFAPGETVMAVSLPAYGRTLLLCICTLLCCLIIALMGAILFGEATRRQSVVTAPLYVLTAAPSYVVAVCLMMALNGLVKVFLDDAGYVTPSWYPIPLYAEDSLMPYVFAAFALMAGDGLFMDFFNAVRAELNALRNAQFIAAIRSKGARIRSHIARNMIVPLISGYAARLPIVLGGVVIVEYVFTLDGGGYVLLEAAKERDFPVVVGISVLFTATIILVNIIADVVQALIDPREVSRGG